MLAIFTSAACGAASSQFSRLRESRPSLSGLAQGPAANVARADNTATAAGGPPPGRRRAQIKRPAWAATLGRECCVAAAGLSAAQVSALGVSTQRSSFVTWHRETGRPFHNFITWKDVRADDLVRQWNASLTLKGLHVGTRLLYAVTRSQRFLAASVLKLMNSQVRPRAARFRGPASTPTPHGPLGFRNFRDDNISDICRVAA
ncbi:Uncharacterized protein GBIM_17604 [Gryllus bimaculatus]|nr:Uncharacterized protein GBIM_17604 [Gryllus bimaculatus]